MREVQSDAHFDGAMRGTERPYDWEPLLSPVLQAYRSIISEATGFTPYRLTFGHEMRLPINLGTPLPEP